jgi:hypothetical protein
MTPRLSWLRWMPEYQFAVCCLLLSWLLVIGRSLQVYSISYCLLSFLVVDFVVVLGAKRSDDGGKYRTVSVGLSLRPAYSIWGGLRTYESKGRLSAVQYLVLYVARFPCGVNLRNFLRPTPQRP